MTKKRRIYQIGIALLLCFMQTAGIAMYGQNRPRAAAKRIHRLQADSLNAIRQAARIPSDSLGLTMDEPVLHQAVTSADSIATADSIAAENKKKLLEMTSAPALEEPEAPADSLKREINPKVWVPNPTKATWLALVIPGGGQIYNRKYWKLPIFYGGFAGCAYALTWNGKMYKDYSTAYKDAMNGNMQSSSITDLLPPGYTVAQAKRHLSQIPGFKYLRLYRSISAIRHRRLCGRRAVQFRHHSRPQHEGGADCHQQSDKQPVQPFRRIAMQFPILKTNKTDLSMTNKPTYMKRIIIGSSLLFSVLLAAPQAYAQESVDVIIRENGTERREVIDLPKSMTYPVDSLLNDWKAKNYIDLGKDCSTSTVNPEFSDSVYIDRLSRMPTVMEMPYNEIVRKFIDMYAGRLRNQVAFMLSACNFYMPIFEEALDTYGLPLELKYLPIIESALNPSAVSRAGASGLWQFMLNTGKIYGLESNSLVDERRDPIKATWAAARYLKDMYAIYQDWNLVIAAYNCGPGTINKAIRRAGGKTDYWEIYNYLPKETRGYVPAFIAANYVMTYYCKHNICPMETNIPDATDTVQVNRNLHFEQIADVCGIGMDELKSLNPQYKKNIIPGDSKPQTLRLPINSISTFIDKQDTIYAHRSAELFKNRRTVSVADTRSKARGSKGKSSSQGDVTYHRIRNGETLSTIARKYGVTVNQIKSWNGLRSTKINAGKRLKIYK